jgi:hypothetical protein
VRDNLGQRGDQITQNNVQVQLSSPLGKILEFRLEKVEVVEMRQPAGGRRKKSLHRLNIFVPTHRERTIAATLNFWLPPGQLLFYLFLVLQKERGENVFLVFRKKNSPGEGLWP